MRTLNTLLALWLISFFPNPVRSECREQKIVPGAFEYTDDFYFSASSTEGAPLEIVGVDLSLTIEALHPDKLVAAGLVVAYDPAVTELLGEPIYSEAFEELESIPFFFELGAPEGMKGFIILWSMRALRESDAILGIPISIGRVYFRIHGKPGDSFRVSFVDNVLFDSLNRCLRSQLTYEDEITNREKLAAYSTKHVSGLVQIVDREPIRTEPPSLPPDAKIYSDPPTNEAGGVRYELSGGIARPGDKVSVDLFITSNYDFVGYVAAGKFPAEYLRLERIEVLTTPGVQLIDNDKGEFGVYSTNSRRRMGAEGERVHTERMYFRVREEARAVGELRITLEDLTQGVSHDKSYENRVLMRHKGLHVTPTVEVSPLVLAESVLKIRSGTETPRGDANFDGTLDLSDPVLVIEYLFLGREEPRCLTAADFNLDGRLDIADSISMFSTLFFRSSRPDGPSEVPCN